MTLQLQPDSLVTNQPEPAQETYHAAADTAHHAAPHVEAAESSAEAESLVSTPKQTVTPKPRQISGYTPQNVVIPFRLAPQYMQYSSATAPMQARTDTVPEAVNDSIARADSIKKANTPPAIVLTTPKAPPTLPHVDFDPSLSWATGLLILLFCLVCFRFRKNRKYVRTVLSDLFEVRERHNAFDDTVRETSFLVLLNILWACCAGVLLWGALVWLMPLNPAWSFPSPLPTWGSMKICIGVTLCYTGIMACAYWIVGTVFTDGRHARMWVKGFAASLALLSVAFLPLALLCIYYQQWRGVILTIALATFAIAKIIFICKGFRIFFAQISSWVLFLYYLCSLEIVPLILTFVSAYLLCDHLLF